MTTAGFVAVFGVFGLLTAPLAGALQRWLPVVTVVVGGVLVVLGMLLLTGRELRVLVPSPVRGAPGTRLVSMFGYGVAFAVASLSCSIGPCSLTLRVQHRPGLVPRSLFRVRWARAEIVRAALPGRETGGARGGVRRAPHR